MATVTTQPEPTSLDTLDGAGPLTLPPKLRKLASKRKKKKDAAERDRSNQVAVVPKKRDRIGERTAWNWAACTWLILIHIGALAAPFYFSWAGLAVFFVMHWMTGSIGICMGFHRLLTHMGFKTYAFVKWTLAVIGGLAGEGSALDWVANHREHHAFSDKEGDPHSPHDGAWWSHAQWLAVTRPAAAQKAHLEKWVPDLLKDPGLRLISNMFLPIQFASGAVFYGLGYLVGGHYMGMSFLVYGVLLRLVGVLHSTWFVNSASHMFGYRNYETTDDSRNNWWVAIIAYGEGWHNNHHAYPRMAVHGHQWWEFDITYQAIRLMSALGLVWDVVNYRRRGEKPA